MTETRYTIEHDWLRLEDDGTVTLGITDHAQQQLGDVVYVELPETGRSVNSGEEVAVVESVKAASDIKAPLSGTVIAVNGQLTERPELVNSDPLGAGWFFRMQVDDASRLQAFLDADGYRRFLEAV